MRPIVLPVIAIATSIAAGLLSVNAAQPPATARISSSNSELLVFEADKCSYCFIFRRDVAPNYLQSPRARDVPMRFINIKQADIKHMQLKAPVRTLPTVILMRNGREVDRISGYMGPEPFFHMISRLIK